jgi:hypothetical protein
MACSSCPTRPRAPFALAALTVLLAHAWLLTTAAGPAPQPVHASAVHPSAQMRLVAARTSDLPRSTPPAAGQPAAQTASSSPLADPQPGAAFAAPDALDGPVVPRSAPDLQRLSGLRFSGLPIRLRLFIDALGHVVEVKVLAAQEDDDTLAAVVGTFSSTAFVPGRMAGMPVASFTDIELRLGGGEG